VIAPPKHNPDPWKPVAPKPCKTKPVVPVTVYTPAPPVKTPCKTKGQPQTQGWTDPQHSVPPVTAGWTAPKTKCNCRTETVTFSFATDPGKRGTWLLEDSGPALSPGESLTYDGSTWTVGTWTDHGNGTLGNDKEYFTLVKDATTLSGIIGAPVQVAHTICTKTDPKTDSNGQKCNHHGINHPVSIVR
jgi:hypothetical protein